MCASPKNDESRGPMQQLTEQEKKRIQRYCTYPKIAATALVMSFVACLLMLPLQMINDIAFHQKEFQPAGICTAIALTAIELCHLLLLRSCAALWNAGQTVEGAAEQACGSPD